MVEAALFARRAPRADWYSVDGRGTVEIDTPAYSIRYDEALAYAARLHATQMRKGNPGEAPTIPYIAHLLEVSSLVWSGGGTEDEAIAGLLHDALEDQHEHTSVAEIGRRFGTTVARLVEHCTDGEPGERRDGSTWLARKVPYLVHLWEDADSSGLLVTTADKISNARAIVSDHADVGDVLWTRFNATPGQIAWYYEQVAQVVEHVRPDQPLTRRLRELVDQIVTITGGIDPLDGVDAAENVQTLEVAAAVAAARERFGS